MVSMRNFKNQNLFKKTVLTFLFLFYFCKNIFFVSFFVLPFRVLFSTNCHPNLLVIWYVCFFFIFIFVSYNSLLTLFLFIYLLCFILHLGLFTLFFIWVFVLYLD